MDSEAASVLIRFFGEIDILLVILVRILGFVIIIPVLSTMNIPFQVKMAFAVVVANLVFISGKVTAVYYDDNLAGYIMLIVTEFLTGFAAGFVVNLIFTVFYYVGQIIDYKIGFAMVSVLDPLSQIQVPITGNLLYLFITIMLVASGGLNAFLAAFFYSFDAIPPGTASLLSNRPLTVYMVETLRDFLVIGVNIAMPVIGAILVLDVALGVMVKAVPQMNVFVVGMPIKIFVGLMVFVMMLPFLGGIYNFVFDESYRHIINIIDWMTLRT